MSAKSSLGKSISLNCIRRSFRPSSKGLMCAGCDPSAYLHGQARSGLEFIGLQVPRIATQHFCVGFLSARYERTAIAASFWDNAEPIVSRSYCACRSGFSETARPAEREFFLKYSHALARGVLYSMEISQSPWIVISMLTSRHPKSLPMKRPKDTASHVRKERCGNEES
jgi:hypothetical protein